MTAEEILAQRELRKQTSLSIRQDVINSGVWGNPDQINAAKSKSSAKSSTSSSGGSARSKNTDSSKKDTNVSKNVKNRMTVFPENGKWLKKGSDDAGTAIVASGLDAGNDFLAGIIGAPESIFRGAAAVGTMQQEMEFYQNGGIYTLEQENANKKKAEQAKSAAAELIT